ncbi:MAG: serine/threonine protein kinase [Acidobacteria bacterium]|nr:serine/threonine protein kinase [Acidobacteriota bacterium]MCB9398821.1 serine/threonine protein kinase [Acidobacteriota bacterium]
MEKEYWQKLKEIFLQVIEVPKEQQQSVLEALCQGDIQLQEQVEKLIKEDGSATLEFQLKNNPASFQQPDKLGAYTIERVIGRGGMGTVFLANRCDQTYQKKVAIKWLHHALAQPEAHQRFRYERQILANLDHPNICQLLDGGLDHEDNPYFVMEYIEGHNLLEYANQNRLTIRARVELFLQVCHAVHFAHNHLIVHRDLKPGNIMVTQEGQVKLLDFGIAKVLDQAAPDFAFLTALETRTGAMPMTPQYASPEQYLGKPITVATDIYCLGLVLFELLTGRPAYNFKNKSLAQIDQMIVHETPSGPSTALSQLSADADTVPTHNQTLEKVVQTLKGDLDAIVLMALRKDPERRYPSAQSLISDLEAHLAGRPVLAHPESRLYRFRKFVQRNALLSVLIGVSTLLLVGLAGVSAYSAWITQRKNTEISQQRDRAQATADYLSALILNTDPLVQDASPSIQEVLDRAYLGLQDQLQNQPQVKAGLSVLLARAFSSYGDLKKSEQLLDLAEKNGQFTTLETIQVQLIRAHSLGLKGQFEESNHLLDMAIASAEQIQANQLLGLCLNQKALNLMDNFQHEAGVALLDRALAIALELGQSGQNLQIMTLRNRGRAKMEKWNVAEGKKDLDQALEMAQETLGPSAPACADLILNRSLVHVYSGDAKTTIQEINKTLPELKQILGERHRLIGDGMDNLGFSYSADGDQQKALEAFNQALDIKKEIYGPEHYNIAFTEGQIGLCYSRLGQKELALAHYQKAEDMARRLLPPTHGVLLLAQVNLASGLDKLGRYQESQTILEEVCRNTASREPVQFYYGVACLLLGRCLNHLEKYEEAIPLLEKSIEVADRYPEQVQYVAALPRYRLGQAMMGLHRDDQALVYWQTALDQFISLFGPDHPFSQMVFADLETYYQAHEHVDFLAELRKKMETQTRN